MHAIPTRSDNAGCQKKFTVATAAGRKRKSTGILRQKSPASGHSWGDERGDRQKVWLRSYRQLLRFQSEFGHCEVPDLPHYRKLASWCAQQRHIHVQGRLSDLRAGWLSEIGFRWESASVRRQSPRASRASLNSKDAANTLLRRGA
jgi:Helicase associated domain